MAVCVSGPGGGRKKRLRLVLALLRALLRALLGRRGSHVREKFGNPSKVVWQREIRPAELGF